MNKKILALIIVAVIIVGGYASYYAYATMVLMPEDLKDFKEDLKNMSDTTFNNSTPSESSINMIEDFDALSLLSQGTRDEMANNLTNSSDSAKSELEEVKQNFTERRDKAQKYDFMLRGDIAGEIRLAYDQKALDYVDKLLANLDKQAEDIKKGDSTAYANDLREFSNLTKEFNSYALEVKEHLQNVVDKMGG